MKLNSTVLRLFAFFSLLSASLLAPPAAAQTPTLDSEQWAFLSLINDFRAQNGAGPLQVSIALQNASQWMSDDMASKSYFSHTDSLGRDPGARMAQFGYPYFPWGENIAAGNSGAQNTFNQWANSPGHRANMLNAGFRVIGIGRAYNPSAPYRWYWTTNFGGVVDQVLTPGGGGVSPPVIQSFTANPSSITAGQASTLSWNVTGATSLTINQGVGSVLGWAGVAVYPTQTTTLTLTAGNSAGTATASVTITVTSAPAPDTQPPSAPTISSAAAKGPTQVDLAWTPSTDNVGVAGYQILRNGAQIALVSAATLSYSDYGVVANTNYAYSVRAYDGAGNYSSPSNTAFVLTPSQTPTSGGPCPGPGSGVFKGCYYSNISLAGNPVFTRDDSQVNFDWGATAPAPALSPAGYSVRWEGNLAFEGGEYTFTATTSDGIRVYIDGALLFDSWKDQPPTFYTFGATVAPGTRLVKVEYYSRSGTSSVHLSWQLNQTRQRRGGAPPVISFFNATPSTIAAGQSSTLSWSVAGATSVTLSNGIGDVTNATSRPVSPSQTTTYTLTASNADGSASAAATVTVSSPPQGDTQPPTAPTLTSASANSATQVSLAWTAATDNVGVTGYQILRNGSLLTSVAGGTLSYSDLSVAANTSYTYAVRAVDAAGNVSPQSNTRIVTTPAPPSSNNCGTPGAGVFTACYYNNLALSGTPVLVRTDNQINFDWRNGTPDPAVMSFNFSVRWQGNFDFQQGDYLFSALTSDGMRVYVDGVLIIDGWREQAPTQYASARSLTQGQHLVTVEYFVRTGTGSAHLNWQQASGRAGR